MNPSNFFSLSSPSRSMGPCVSRRYWLLSKRPILLILRLGDAEQGG